MRPTLHADITLGALRMALWRRRPEAGLIHHSDRGVQYACNDFQRALAAQQIRCSMSRKGDCWDNAVAESFFATLEWELVERSDWHTRREAERDVFNYIEVWYNRERRHSTLGYLSPADYETQLTQSGKAA
jgi:transposase InsO family protein